MSTQVPDHRLEELMAQQRRLAEENQRLRGMIDQIYQRTPQTSQQQPTKSPFTEDVDKALEEKFKALLTPIQQRYQQDVGALYEQNDLLRFQQTYGGEQYQKYSDKIEALRADRQRMGQWISREDAYKHVYYEETAKKAQPKPEPPKAAPGPQLDPYTGRIIEAAPATETVAQNPPAAPAQVTAQGPVPMPQQTPPAAPSPMMPQLPPQTMNPAAPPAVSAQIPKQVDIDLPTTDLDAWAAKYGDVTF